MYRQVIKSIFILYHLIGTCKWIVPVKTGDKLPPYSYFNINSLPGNKAVLFGGGFIDEKGQKDTTGSSMFMISFTDSCVVSTFYYIFNAE